MKRAFALALGSMLLAGTAPALAQTVLTMSSWVPPSHLMHKVVLEGFAAEVERVTEGRVKFRLLPKAPASPPGSFDAVRDGLTDMTFGVPGYQPARFILPGIAELPGGGTTSEINSGAYSRIHWKYMQQAGEFKGVKLLGVFTHGPGQMFNSKKPINTLADLATLKIRTGGGVADQMARALGASAFVKPSTESYELLSTGVADGVFFPLESVTAFKLQTVVKHATLFPGGFYNAVLALFMSEEKFKALPKRDQDAIDSIAGEKVARTAGKAWDDADKAALAILKEAGVTIADASPALVKDVQAKSTEVEQAWIKAAGTRGIDGAKVLAEFRAELKKVAAGN